MKLGAPSSGDANLLKERSGAVEQERSGTVEEIAVGAFADGESVLAIRGHGLQVAVAFAIVVDHVVVQGAVKAIVVPVC